MIMMYITPHALNSYMNGLDFSGINVKRSDNVVTVMVPDDRIKQYTFGSDYITFDVKGHDNGTIVYGNYKITSKGLS